MAQNDKSFTIPDYFNDIALFQRNYKNVLNISMGDNKKKKKKEIAK